jgi:hypothetical protein
MGGGGLASVSIMNPTGQLHYGISNSIFRALQEHRNLRGLYQARDPRFVTRAKELVSHRGYQRWHIDLDNEISEYISTRPFLSSQNFEKYLIDRYNQSDLITKFPNGF